MEGKAINITNVMDWNNNIIIYYSDEDNNPTLRFDDEDKNEQSALQW